MSKLKYNNILGVYYSVAVLASPSDGPHPIGSTLNLTCSIYPLPPDDVTYKWTSSELYQSITAPDISMPVVMVTIGSGHSKEARYFCSVYSGSNLLAVGSTVITVQGI